MKQKSDKIFYRRDKKTKIYLIYICISFIYCLLPLLLFANEMHNYNSCYSFYRPQLVVKGIVSNNVGDILPGVTIQVLGTTTGVVTNDKGEYLITVPSDTSTLIVSSIGYKQQKIQVNGRAKINIVLQPTGSGLDEVIVVGYGTQKKVSVTGAISTISMDQVERSSTPSISNAIAGKLPGIITRQNSGEPGSDAAQVFIRGIGTYGANRTPLVLVDGIQRDMNNINTEEIESISVLKDASATAIYGVRGANGVILIKTKRGKIGKPKVRLRTETAMLTPLRLPNYIDGSEYAGLVNEALKYAGKSPLYSDQDIELFRNGSDPYFHPNVDWTDVILKDHTYQTINNLNISGGTQTIRYFANVGFTLKNGIYKTDDLDKYNANALIKRYNFRLNVDMNLSENFSLGLGLGGIIQYGNYPGAGTGTGTGSDAIFDALKITSPIMFPIKNPDGSPGGVPNFLGSNPWGLLNYTGYIRKDRNVFQGTFKAKWDLSKWLTKGLSIRGKFGYDYYYQGNQIRRKQFEIKEYLGQDSNGDDEYNVLREETALGYNIVDDINRRIYTELAVNYNRGFGKHNVSGMLLVNRSENIDLTAATSTGNLPKRREGLAGRFTYGFDNRYLAEFNFGYNGSENFPKGERFGFFPAVSVGWIVSNEDFWNVDFINKFKLRGSYGLVGNDQIGQRFLYISRINRSAPGYRFGDAQQFWGGFAEGFIADPNVTWEVAKKSNLGLDLGLFNDKITLQVDAFRGVRENILTQRRKIPFIVGFAMDVIPFANLGKVKNRGIDALLKIQNTTHYGLYYSLLANFTYAKNEILENDQPEQLYSYLTEAGNPVGQPFGLEAIGLFRDQKDIDTSAEQRYSIPRPGDIKYKDQNGDGIINDFDRLPIGYPRIPEINYGFGGTVAYKQIDFSVYFIGASRASMFVDGNSIQPFGQGFGSGTVLHAYYDNRWTIENPNGYYPRILDGRSPNNYRLSTYYQKNASYIRLRNVELGYTFPNKLTKKIGIEKARFFVNAMNVYTWDHIKIINPESDNGTGGYPLNRSTNIGLEINF